MGLDTINLVITVRTDKKWLEKISALSPKLQVVDATELFQAERDHERASQRPPPGALDKALAEAEILYCMYLPSQLMSRAPRLRWLHIFTTGIEKLQGTGVLDSSLLITNARGIPAFHIAEHVIMFMLMFARNMPLVMANQRQKLAKRTVPTSLEGKTVGVVGVGSIGSHVARLAKALGMRVIATRRSATTRQEGKDGIDMLYPPGELKSLLSESDFVVLALPLTSETKHLIGEAELRAMKPTAYLINVSRGTIVDEAALIAALRQGWMAGAGLDVTEREPLPAESPLWEMPNVILTPHEAGATDVYRDKGAALFCENLRRYLAGQPLLNVVDKTKGY